MSSRCTPFGLFAGCSIGEISDKTAISLDETSKHARHTSFDMNFLVALAQQIASDEHIKYKLLFYPNTSIYKSGKNVRYIEYSQENNNREYSIEAVKNTPYINSILLSAQKGSTLKTIAKSITRDDICFNDALQFVEELATNQLLVSELEPSMTGDDFLIQIIDRLQRIIPDDLILNDLRDLSDALIQIDKNMGNAIDSYLTISHAIKKFKTPFELKYRYQTDLYPKIETNRLSRSTFQAVKRGMKLLNRMTLKDTDTQLDRFKIAFIKRYKEKEIPLSVALDIEMGIGYIQNNTIADYTPILDDLQLPEKKEFTFRLAWNSIDNIFHKKLIQSNSRNEYVITLLDKDFSEFEENWDDLPTTISTLAEISIVDSEEFIFFDAVGGSSAANLFARFCNGDASISEYTKSIIAKEESYQLNKIHAEIIHLPEARTGNILKRPVFRKYEIPYLAQSNLPIDEQIPINDLMLSIRENRIILRSITHNLEVIPHLTNAHNFRWNSLPIYNFLCDMKTQNLRGSMHFSWRNITKNQSFLPRVVYNVEDLKKTIIFSKAKWIIRKNEIISFYNKYNTVNELLEAVNKWRKKLNMPQYVQLMESDNALLINLKNYNSIIMLLNTIKNKQTFTLEEFLFYKDGIVKSKQGYHTNQFVFSFYKDKT